jgi:hypothetical protein
MKSGNKEREKIEGIEPIKGLAIDSVLSLKTSLNKWRQLCLSLFFKISKNKN